MEDKLAEAILRGKKYTFQEKKVLFVGLVNEMIYDTKRFNNNLDLKSYISTYEKHLNDNEPFKDYLYQSRPLLSARVTKLVLKNTDRDLTNFLVNEHLTFLNKNSKEKEITTKKAENNLLDDFLNARSGKR